MAEAARFLTESCKQKGQAWKCWKTAIPCSPLGCCRSRWKYNGKYICPDAALVLLVNRHRLLPGLSFWPLSWPLTSLLKEKGKFFRKLVYNPNVRVKNPEEGYGFFFFFTAALEVNEHQSILISCLVSINVALPGTQGIAVVCQNQLIFFHKMLQAPQNVVRELAHI